MKRFLHLALAGLLLFASVPALSADKKPLQNSAGQIRPFQTGDTVAVANGGTGATTASAARTGLGLGTFATQDYATPPAIGGTTPAAGAFSTLSATGNLTTNVTGSTQCLHVNSSGVVSGAGSDCSVGGSVTFKDEGSTLTTGTTSVDCVGAGITCTNSTGAVTLTVSGGSSGVLTLISEVTTASSQADVTWSGIAGTYRDLEIRVRARGTAAAVFVTVVAQFNTDTAANYDIEDGHWFGNVTGFSQTLATTSLLLGYIPAASSTAGYAGGCQAIVHDYRGTTFNKIVDGTFGTVITNGATSAAGGQISGQWKSTAAITAVKVFLSSGNFVNGSVVSLYGRM